MEAKTKKTVMYVTGGILAAILIYLGIQVYRYRQIKKDLTSGSNTTGGTSTGTSTGSGGTTSPAPYHGTDSTKWKIGEVIKALNTVNIYSSIPPTTTNILTTIHTLDQVKIVDIVGIYIMVNYVSVNYLGYPTVKKGYILPGHDLTN